MEKYAFDIDDCSRFLLFSKENEKLNKLLKTRIVEKFKGNGGDVRLAKETIDAIREVEKKAEEAEKKAKASAKEIVEKAKADAETLKKDGANSQLRRAEAEMADAKRRQDELFAQKDIETNQLVTELKEKASEKRAAAIDAVLAALS